MTAAAWREIWERIDQRRVELGMSWRSLQREGGVSQRTLFKMRDDGVALQSPAKRSNLARALKWTPDSIDRLLAGDLPQLAEAHEMGPLDWVALAFRRLGMPAVLTHDLVRFLETNPPQSLKAAEHAIREYYEQHGRPITHDPVEAQVAELRARVEVLEAMALGDRQFAVAAEGAEDRPPHDAGQRVSRPRPEPED